MDLNIEIVKFGDIIRTTPTGQLDMESTRNMLQSLAQKASVEKDRSMLVDIRKTSSILQKLDLFELASSLVNYGLTFRRKTAILARNDDSYERATFFELVAINRGYNIGAFTNFEDAVMWLSDMNEEVEESQRSVTPVN